MENRKKILILDDDPRDAELLTALLGMNTYETVVLAPTEGYIAAIAHEHPDLILLNASLKHADSRDVCQALKSAPRLDMVPVVFVNGDDIREEVDAAFDAGAEEYLNRWIGPRMLAKTVDTLLSFDAVLRSTQYPEARSA